MSGYRPLKPNGSRRTREMQGKKSRKRELILNTAFELILKNGYSNTKIIDIANKAGIGKGTVYEYFESKEALLLELIHTRVASDYARVCDEAGKLPTCKLKLKKYLELQVETTANYNEAPVNYKMNVTDFISEFVSNNSEISMKILDAVHSIALLQFEFVYDTIQTGVTAGEFKNLNPYAATVCFMGSISFYISMIHKGVWCRETQNFQRFILAADEDSLLDCLFKGLLI